MTTQRFLYLTSGRLSAYLWKRQRMLPEGSFMATETGLTGFAAYLKTRKNSHFRILANLRDESHQVETIPYLRGKDRQALISRKIGQLFVDTPLVSAVSLGYEKDRRKNERILLSGLTCPADFQPWLACLAAAEVPLAGVYSISQLGGELLRKLGLQPTRCLLLTLHDDVLRESFIVEGKTLFSRQAPVSGNGITTVCADEAARLQQYLAGQGMMDRQDSLPVFVLTHPRNIGTTSPDSSNFSCTFLDPHFVAQKLELGTPPVDDRNELLFLYFLATRAPRQQFANSQLRLAYRLSRSRQALAVLTAIFLSTALAFTGKCFYNSLAYRNETGELASREKELVRRHAEIAATQPRSAIDYGSLQRINARFADLQHFQRQPHEAYRIISRALDPWPAIELDSIDWKVGDGTNLACCNESMVLQGTVKLTPESSPRQALAVFEGFIRILGQDPSTRVAVRRPPFDAASGEVFQGKDGSQAGSHPFAIEIARQLPP